MHYLQQNNGNVDNELNPVNTPIFNSHQNNISEQQNFNNKNNNNNGILQSSPSPDNNYINITPIKYKCTVCSKILKTSSYLLAHIRIHTSKTYISFLLTNFIRSLINFFHKVRNNIGVKFVKRHFPKPIV